MVGTAWINSQVQIKNELRHHVVIRKVQIKDLYYKSNELYRCFYILQKSH